MSSCSRNYNAMVNGDDSVKYSSVAFNKLVRYMPHDLPKLPVTFLNLSIGEVDGAARTRSMLRPICFWKLGGVVVAHVFRLPFSEGR